MMTAKFSQPLYVFGINCNCWWISNWLLSVETCKSCFCITAEGFLILTRDILSVYKVGSSVEFSCTTNTSDMLLWNYFNEKRGFLRIYNGNKIHRDFVTKSTVSFNANTGIGVLTVRDVQPEDEGTYTCRELQSDASSVEFELFVNGQTFTLACDVFQLHYVIGDVRAIWTHHNVGQINS